jgi:hypothetical protein
MYKNVLGKSGGLISLALLLFVAPAVAADAPSPAMAQSRQQDEQNEQRMLNDQAWTGSSASADTAAFDQRTARIDRVLKDLEIGVLVHWSDLKQALAVLPSPY